ncbi:Hypothetical protein NTJ_12124 [Nesidiocoris tenuis]|uniref:Uncharacterized protein n=1 Tax=Nesidiocoris tenuis TaxID=355587 RepID=A0ABN7B935_9HEMI|nr:Hypothetical protein NTJ_12124 [Nesidiocoris tenuis]
MATACRGHAPRPRGWESPSAMGASLLGALDQSSSPCRNVRALSLRSVVEQNVNENRNPKIVMSSPAKQNGTSYFVSLRPGMADD